MAGLCVHTWTETEMITQFLLPNTYSEGGALFNNGRQLRQADVDGQVPRLPAGGAQERKLPLETRHQNSQPSQICRFIDAIHMVHDQVLCVAYQTARVNH